MRQELHIAKNAERLAIWLESIRAAGRPCPTNLIGTAQARFKSTKAIARAIITGLKLSGRLIVNPMRKEFSIDGRPFAVKVEDRDEADVVKTILRRRYKPVYDPRTALKPLAVAKGEPAALVVGGEIIPFHQCKQIAQEIETGA